MKLTLLYTMSLALETLIVFLRVSWLINSTELKKYSSFPEYSCYYSYWFNPIFDLASFFLISQSWLNPNTISRLVSHDQTK